MCNDFQPYFLTETRAACDNCEWQKEYETADHAHEVADEDHLFANEGSTDCLICYGAPIPVQSSVQVSDLCEACADDCLDAGAHNAEFLGT